MLTISLSPILLQLLSILFQYLLLSSLLQISFFHIQNEHFVHSGRQRIGQTGTIIIMRSKLSIKHYFTFIDTLNIFLCLFSVKPPSTKIINIQINQENLIFPSKWMTSEVNKFRTQSIYRRHLGKVCSRGKSRNTTIPLHDQCQGRTGLDDYSLYDPKLKLKADSGCDYTSARSQPEVHSNMAIKKW